MLHVFVGDDLVKVRARTHAFLDTMREGHFEHVTADTYSSQGVREQLSATSLFGELDPLVMDCISEDAEALADFELCVTRCAETPRTVVYMDSKPRVALEKTLRKFATSYEEVSGTKAAKERFNTFSLADAFARKDKKALWVIFMRARMAGVSGEEIAGVLFWQLKALRLAQSSSSAEEAGMKEFTYKKAKMASKLFSKEELERLSETLLSVYHDGHFDRDMEVGVERFLLGV